MEIERKWMVTGWPEGLPLEEEFTMRQGYISVQPTVRIRELEEKIIGKPLIKKVRRSYRLPDGAVLEVNHVDEGLPTAFWYAEVEYPTVEAALSWQPAACGLVAYLNDEVTNQPGQSMGAYWVQTRG